MEAQLHDELAAQRPPELLQLLFILAADRQLHRVVLAALEDEADSFGLAQPAWDLGKWGRTCEAFLRISNWIL